jgi:hypothetical protein
MKAILDKIFQAAAAVFITWVIVAGVGYAGANCCRLVKTDCIQASYRSFDKHSSAALCLISPSHQMIERKGGAHCTEQLNARHGDSPVCCETNRCDTAAQTARLSPNVPLPTPVVGNDNTVSPPAKVAPFQNAVTDQQLRFQTSPIFILTKSILC